MLTLPLRLKQSCLVPSHPTTTGTPKLLLLLHPILFQWDKGVRHSTPAWPLTQGAKQLLLPLFFLSDFLSLRSGVRAGVMLASWAPLRV